MKIKEGNIYINRKNGMFVHIKEITKYNVGIPKPICNIVTSSDCDYKHDAKSTCIRAIYNYNEFTTKYMEENTNWNLIEQSHHFEAGYTVAINWDIVQVSDIIKCRNLILQDFMKMKLNNNITIPIVNIIHETTEIINKRFGEF